MKFEKGIVYHTIRTLGVVKKSNGELHISQRTGKDATDIQPSEKLVFDGRENGRLLFVREDGTRVCGHKSHFDASDPYNVANVEEKHDVAETNEQIKRKQIELDIATRRLDELLEIQKLIKDNKFVN